MIVNPSHSINAHLPLSTDAVNLTLLIDVNEQHICIVRLDKDKNCFEGLEYYYLFQFNSTELVDILQTIFKKYEPLKNYIKNVLVYYSTRDTLLVPTALYSESTFKWMAEQTIGKTQNEILFKENLKALDLVIVYPIQQLLHDALLKSFPNAEFSNFNAEWLRKTIKENLPTNLFEVLFFPKMITVIIWQDSKLQIVQSYPYDNQEDILYYFLSVVSSFNLTPENVETKLSGLIDFQSPVFEAIVKLFPNLSLTSKPENCSFHPAFEEQPNHFFTPVLSLESCVS
jgi:Protein of unknown function (DUF3822)